jgi:hypothetical protein
MNINPYKSPDAVFTDCTGTYVRRSVLWAVAWIVSFLSLAISVVVSHVWPCVFKSYLPEWESNPLVLISLAMRVRVDAVCAVSLILCTCIAAYAPLSSAQRAVVMCAWFPLMILQIIAILVCLLFAGRLSA